MDIEKIILMAMAQKMFDDMVAKDFEEPYKKDLAERGIYADVKLTIKVKDIDTEKLKASFDTPQRLGDLIFHKDDGGKR